MSADDRIQALEKRIEALESPRSIRVSNADSEHGPTCVIRPDGIWLNRGDNARFVSIQTADGMPCVCVGDHRKGMNLLGHQIALFVDKDGEPVIQIARPNGKTETISGEKLQKLIGG